MKRNQWNNWTIGFFATLLINCHGSNFEGQSVWERYDWEENSAQSAVVAPRSTASAEQEGPEILPLADNPCVTQTLGSKSCV